MFWVGLLIGAWIGAIAGVVVMILLRMSSDGEAVDENN